MLKSPKFLSIEELPLLKRPQKYKYPKAVVFVLITKLFEAFAANGIRTILALFLRDDLSFSESFSTVLLHIFNFFGQFTPIFGAILADSYIGNVQTISYFCVIYAVGWYGLFLTSFPSNQLPLLFMVSLSLLLISIGNGSIRACITSLGAKQFKIPEQNELLSDYFSHYYFVYYMGIFLSKIVPPMIRAETSCFGKDGCYPAVFGSLGSIFMMSWIVFLIGKIYYKDERISDENVILKFFGCIKHALSTKMKSCGESKDHWIEYAEGKYSHDFIDDVHTVLKITKLFIPLPIYYALLAQQDSSWTFQASQMETTILGFRIEPDQAKAMGPVFLFTLIPIWTYIVVPVLRSCDIEISPLKSMVIGGFVSGVSFICAGILQIQIDSSPVNTVNILWQVPQFFLIMVGELLLSIPGLEFAFKQAPESMKSVLTAAFFINNAFGNLIVVLLTEIDVVKSQTIQYFVYSVLMLLGILLFIYLVRGYTRRSRFQYEDILDESDNNNALSRTSSIGEFVM
ncbi:SLC15A1.2 family protein [Megaselia abdita]